MVNVTDYIVVVLVVPDNGWSYAKSQNVTSPEELIASVARDLISLKQKMESAAATQPLFTTPGSFIKKIVLEYDNHKHEM